MKKKIGIFLGIFIFVLLLGVGHFLFKNDDNDVLDEIVLKNNNSNKDLFAIYVEELQDDGTYQYVKSDNTSFKKDDNHTYNRELSGCIDENGNPIDGSLTYNNKAGTVSLKTKNASLCYLYFDIRTLASDIIDFDPKGLTKTTNPDDEMSYRFVGSNKDVDNFICFGASGQCQIGEYSTHDEHMYRIIGTTKDGKIKISKLLEIETPQSPDFIQYNLWTISQEWQAGDNEALLHQMMNGENFLTNSRYMDKGWEEKIADNNWYLPKFSVDATESVQDTIFQTQVSQFLKKEKAVQATIPSKIGFPYLTDIFYANDISDYPICWFETNNLNGRSSTNCKSFSSWLAGEDNTDLWYAYKHRFITLDYMEASNFGAPYTLYECGSMTTDYGPVEYGIFPTFYLKSDLKIDSGSGTSDDPFILN